MALDLTSPADTEYLSTAPGKIRENDRAIVNDKVVNAGKLQDLTVGNASGNIPVNNGTLNVGLNAEKLNGQTGSYYSPATHVHAVATTTANGFLSNTDKTKLDGIAAGAEVNQNTFGSIKVGTTTIQADVKVDTLELKAGTGITLTPDATNDAVTVAVTQDGHNHAAATTGAAGFMSANDKSKLDGIAAGAEVNQSAFATIVAGGVSASADSKQDTFTINAGSGITITGDAANDACTIAVTANGHTHNDATASAAGFMTAAMVTKLNGVAAGAQTNQNAFSNVLVGTTIVAADSATDTLELVAGPNITLTPDATNDRVTIAVTGTVPAASTCTGNAATATTAGTCTGNAATATILQTARTIALSGKVTGTATNFNGSANITIPVTAVTADSCTGNAATATTASACTGNAATATKLATARTIAGVSFDGSANISIPYANLTGLPAIPVSSGRQLFTANETFTVPAGVTTVWVSMCGGGGGGQGGYSVYGGAGGGGAGCQVKYPITNLVPGQSIVVTVGAGGVGSAGNMATGENTGGTGGAGGTSSFGTYCSAPGGSGGRINHHLVGTCNYSDNTLKITANIGGYAGGIGGTDGTAYLNDTTTTTGGTGGLCIFSGVTVGAKGGTGTTTYGNPGSDAIGYGNGGGGGGKANKNTGGTGGNGAPGFVLVEW